MKALNTPMQTDMSSKVLHLHSCPSNRDSIWSRDRYL